MKNIWKTVLIVTVALLIIGAAFIGVAMITGADFGRVQDLFNTTYNVSSFREYYTGIVQTLLGIQPLT